MKLKNKLAAGISVLALGAAGLFAQAQATAPRQFHRGERFSRMATALNLTDDQKAQAHSIFDQARESAKPVRQQLMETRKSLRAAIQSGDNSAIQQLSSTEGSEVGQLTAIRSAAFAQVYKTLTPEQQQKMAALEQQMHQHRRGPASHGSAS